MHITRTKEGPFNGRMIRKFRATVTREELAALPGQKGYISPQEPGELKIPDKGYFCARTGLYSNLDDGDVVVCTSKDGFTSKTLVVMTTQELGGQLSTPVRGMTLIEDSIYAEVSKLDFEYPYMDLKSEEAFFISHGKVQGLPTLYLRDNKSLGFVVQLSADDLTRILGKLALFSRAHALYSQGSIGNLDTYYKVDFSSPALVRQFSLEADWGENTFSLSFDYANNYNVEVSQIKIFMDYTDIIQFAFQLSLLGGL